jgi:hypothetical protein
MKCTHSLTVHFSHPLLPSLPSSPMSPESLQDVVSCLCDTRGRRILCSSVLPFEHFNLHVLRSTPPVLEFKMCAISTYRFIETKRLYFRSSFPFLLLPNNFKKADVYTAEEKVPLSS